MGLAEVGALEVGVVGGLVEVGGLADDLLLPWLGSLERGVDRLGVALDAIEGDGGGLVGVLGAVKETGVLGREVIGVSVKMVVGHVGLVSCLLYTSPSPRDRG